MPYMPGVVNNSGQIRAQGMLNAAQNYGSGIAGFADQYAKMKEENDALLSKASATEKFIKAHPELFGGEAKVAEMTMTNARESPMEKYSKLGQFMKDTLVGNELKNAQAQREAAAAQMAQAQMQRQIEAAKLAQFQREQTNQVGLEKTLDQFASYKAGSPINKAEFDRMQALEQNPYLMQQAQMRQATGGVAAPRDVLSNATRSEIADITAASRSEIADARAQAAEDKLNNAKGKYETPEDALLAGIAAIKKAGPSLSGFHPEVVPTAGGTFTVKITKPYATGTDSAERASVNLAKAQDDLELAVNVGDKNAIGKAQTVLEFWKARANRVSQPPNQPKVLDPINYEIAKASVAQAGGDANKMFGTDYGQYLIAHGGKSTSPGKPSTSTMSEPPAAAIAYLRSNPQMADQFDAKYGPGSAKRALGK